MGSVGFVESIVGPAEVGAVIWGGEPALVAAEQTVLQLGFGFFLSGQAEGEKHEGAEKNEFHGRRLG